MLRDYPFYGAACLICANGSVRTSWKIFLCVGNSIEAIHNAYILPSVKTWSPMSPSIIVFLLAKHVRTLHRTYNLLFEIYNLLYGTCAKSKGVHMS